MTKTLCAVDRDVTFASERAVLIVVEGPRQVAARDPASASITRVTGHHMMNRSPTTSRDL